MPNRKIPPSPAYVTEAVFERALLGLPESGSPRLPIDDLEFMIKYGSGLLNLFVSVTPLESRSPESIYRYRTLLFDAQFKEIDENRFGVTGTAFMPYQTPDGVRNNYSTDKVSVLLNESGLENVTYPNGQRIIRFLTLPPVLDNMIDLNFNAQAE